MKVGIIGTGIAGLGCAHFLRGRCELSLFEQNAYPGGHSNTIAVDESGAAVHFDTGFMVYNETTYPLLTRLFRELAVATQPASMSFSVQHRPSGLEYNGGSLDLLFVQRSNLLRPRFYRLLRQINRFNSEAVGVLGDTAYENATVRDLVEARGYGRDFLELYLLPMSSAVWSAPLAAMFDFPAMTLLRFFQNHGFLGLHAQHPWRTPAGGSQSYVRRLVAPFQEALKLNRQAVSVSRDKGSATIHLADGGSERFDKVVMACHGDQSLQLLADSTPREQSLLECVRYQTNAICVHTDESVMPRRRGAWASWNYSIDADAGGSAHSSAGATHYWMNRLQSLKTRKQYFVSLNAEGAIAPTQVLRRMTYEHPLFDRRAIAAQQDIPALNRIDLEQTTYFAGAWTKYGFHEDGLASGLDCARAITGELLWQ